MVVSFILLLPPLVYHFFGVPSNKFVRKYEILRLFRPGLAASLKAGRTIRCILTAWCQHPFLQMLSLCRDLPFQSYLCTHQELLSCRTSRMSSRLVCTKLEKLPLYPLILLYPCVQGL